MRVFLVGMMGSGKTAVGKLLARSLELDFVDMDEEIKKREGKTISRIFQEFGEGYFRAREKDLLRELSQRDNLVVATGGGVVLDAENRQLLHEGRTVFLYAPPPVLAQRVDPSIRPLLKESSVKGKLAKIWESRRVFYEEFPRIDTEHLQPFEVVARVALRLFDEEPQEVFNPVHPVFTGKGLFKRVSREDLVFTTETVHRIYEDLFPPTVQLLPDGELAKSVDHVLRCYDYLMENDVSRDRIITAVGGGALTDLMGFVGATFKRGIGVRFFPTTLLAQVDAAIGGKNGIDYRGVKNMIGTVKMPDEVLIDPLTTLSLDEGRYREGLVELFKMCLLSGNGYDAFREHLFGLLERRVGVLERFIRIAVNEKLKVVAQDENDAGVRKILNFGHTVGHVVEVLSNISHGLAVAVGIERELRFFRTKGLIEAHFHEEVSQILSSIFRLPNVELSVDQVMKTLINDKKSLNTRLIEVPLVMGPGRVSLVKVKPQELAEVIV
ncbi:MAG: bifunctional shikimate kinase AroK/3-dehydroquinate synthase AroB [Thermotogae bacterium]|nr:bifunctional shikimate kinase AroK/3-dehydroquinate synthase AroB [Thermotogota bacterium]